MEWLSKLKGERICKTAIKKLPKMYIKTILRGFINRLDFLFTRKTMTSKEYGMGVRMACRVPQGKTQN